jgi:hypothetical protein
VRQFYHITRSPGGVMAVTLAQAIVDFPVFEKALVVQVFYEMPTVKISPQRWRCAINEHRYHRSEIRAQACEFAAMPMTSVAGEGAAP